MLMMGCSASQIRRMMLLYQHQYVNRPSFDERRRLPEMIYWLDKKGQNMSPANCGGRSAPG